MTPTHVIEMTKKSQQRHGAAAQHDIETASPFMKLP